MADRNDATPRVYTLELSCAEVKALVDYHLAQQEEADSSEAGCIGDAQRARQLQATLDSPGCTRSHPHEEMTVACQASTPVARQAAKDIAERRDAPHPLATRRYTMSESHLSGARVIIGFDTVEEASAAHVWIAKAARVDWRAAVEEIRQGLAANHLSTSDDAGYRNYAEVVLDRLTDILITMEKT